MAKFMKVVKIILISLLVLVLGAYVVLYVVNPELAKQIMATVVDYANRPLPIVGVSSVVLAYLVWKIFQATRFGRKAVSKVKEEYESEKLKVREEYEQKKLEYTAILALYEQEVDLILNAVIQMCNASANKKVKAIGENIQTDIVGLKNALREKFNTVATSDVEVLIQSKEDVIKSIVEMVKKEIEDKYGEEGKETLKGITEAKTL